MSGAVVICQSLRTTLKPMELLVARHGLTAAYSDVLPAAPVCFVVAAGGRGFAAPEEALFAYAERFSVPVYLLGLRPRQRCRWCFYGPGRAGAEAWDENDRATVENHLAFLCAVAERLAEQRLEQILGRAFHSLRTPLVTVDMALSRLAAPAGGSDDPALAQSLEIARRNLARMHYITKRFLKLAGGREGGPEPAEPVALRQVAQECLSLLSPYISQKELRLDLQVEASCVCLGSRSGVTEIVYNLMENAVKFTPPGGTITVTGRGGNAAVFAVEDAAALIPAEERRRVFGRFVRLQPHKSLHPEGAGLGLHIVLDLVEEMGGDIRITAGKSGNRFELALPAGGRT